MIWSELNMNILNMTISGSIIILIILIFRYFAINKLPKLTFIFLWYIAISKLIIPISISTKFSIYNIFNFKNTKEFTTINHLANLNDIDKFKFVGYILNNNKIDSMNTNIIFIIWLLGFVLLLTFFIILYYRCLKEFKTALPINKNYFILSWKNQLKMNRSLKIMVSDKILSPLSYGIFKPVILLPKNMNWSDKISLNYVLEHELTHIRRFDAILKIILSIVLSLHWFNPLVWIMYIVSAKDIELYCDENVVNKFGYSSRADYAKSLISFEETKNKLTPIVNNYTKNSIEERIVAIMKFKKISMVGLILSFTLVAGTATVFATSSNHTINNTAIFQSNTNLDKSYEILKNLFETYTVEEFEEVVNNVIKYSNGNEQTIQKMKDYLEQLKADNSNGDFVIYKSFLDETTDMDDSSSIKVSINPAVIMNPESVYSYTYTQYQQIINSMKPALDKAVEQNKITQEEKDAIITVMESHLNNFK